MWNRCAFINAAFARAGRCLAPNVKTGLYINLAQTPAYLILLICIVALPLVHIFTGAAIPFGNDWFCDTWYYFGLMEFPELGHVLAAGERTISRLPAYVPVSVLRELGATATGQELYFWLNHIIFAVTTVTALTALFEITTALIVSALVTTSALYLAVLSTTYPTGAALAYGSAALACVSIGVRRPPLVMPLALLAGVFVAFALHSHLVSAVFLFFLPILYIMIDIPAFLIGTLLMGVGMLVGTTFVGLTGLYLGQGFWSIGNQIRAVLSGVGVYWYQGWMLRSIGLVLMVLLPALQAITLVGRKRSSKRSQAILVSAIAVSGINLLVTFSHKDQNLVFNFMYILAIPIAALVVADAIEDKTRRISCLACGAVLTCLIGLHVLIVAYLRGYILSHFMPIAFVGATLTLFVSILYARSRSIPGGIAVIGSSFIFMQAALGDYYRDHLYLNRVTARSNTQQVDKALAFIRGYGVTDKPVVWLGNVDNQTIATDAFQSLVRCGFSIDFPDRFPNSTLQWQPPIAPGRLLIVIDDPRKYPSIEDTLARHGVRIERVKSNNIDDSLRITMGLITEASPQ